MTRETKIGLLVGLAFIIVIGILLSDHLQSAAPQTPAYATETRPNVDRSVEAPRSSRPLPPPPQPLEQNRPVEIGIGPAQAESRPRVGVAENEMSVHAPLPEEFVFVGPRARESWNPSQGAEMAQAPERAEGPGVIRSLPQHSAQAPEQRGRIEGNNVLAQNDGRGEGVVQRREPEHRVEDAHEPPPAAVARTIEHVAEPGDTVSKMAQKYLGSRSLANQNLIINANPPLRSNPHKVVVGQKYTIPIAPAEGGRRSEAGAGDRAVGDAAGAGRTLETPADDAERFERLRTILAADQSEGPEVEYTTRPGDTLWGIAVRECNTPSHATVARILEMNRDVLKGDPRNLRPNMKLRLPPKTVPSVGGSAQSSAR